MNLLELTIHLPGVENTTRTIRMFKNIQEFNNSHYHKKGFRIVKDVSNAVLDAISDNQAKAKEASTEKEVKVHLAEETSDTESPEPTTEKSIEDVREEYEKVTGKKVPARYKNDQGWLLAKIDEKAN